MFINLEEEIWRREKLNIQSQNESMKEIRRDIPENFNDRVFNKAVFKKLSDRSK